MNTGETFWLTRVTAVQEAFQARDWAGLGGLDPYQQHQLLWKFFDLPRQANSQPTPFLFRADVGERLPRFYVLSKAAPVSRSEQWQVEARAYRPALDAGDRLSFKLRANPVVKKAGDAVLADDGQPKMRKTGSRAGQVKKKVIRHDVVMEAKRRMDWKNLSQEDRPVLAHVIHEAGVEWLRARAESNGFRFDESALRVDGHTVCRMWHGKRSDPASPNIRLSTLDFEGELEVLDAKQFAKCLLDGIGPAKAFGCGLLLVRRI